VIAPSAVVWPNLTWRERSNQCRKLIAAHRLAGLGPADLDDVAAGGLAAVVMIEGNDAMNLGARQVQRLGQGRERRLGDEAQLLLQVMQDFQQRVRLVAVTDATSRAAAIRLARGKIEEGMFSRHAALWRNLDVNSN
jgi:hypothetical protein